ncbi:helix-turn-helix domain-containing protein [Aeribacillus pallidus]
MLIAWEQEQENSETFHKGNLSYRDQLERERILNMLKKTNGNIGEAAAALNISRSTLYRKLKKYKLS